MTIFRCSTLPLLLAILLLALSCAKKPGVHEASVPMLEREFFTERLVFRHSVTIEVSGKGPAWRLDGLTRLEGSSIHVIGLGKIGLTLFDMLVSPEGRHTNFLHPSLARVPRMEEHIAHCIRSVWFNTLALRQRPATAGQESVMEARRGDLMKHVFAGGRIVKSSSRNLNGYWSVRLSAPYARGEAWPETMYFWHEKPEYLVTIRLLSVQPEILEAR